MAIYQANGTRLGWLLFPHEQAMEVWSTSGAPLRLEQHQVLEASSVFLRCSCSWPRSGRSNTHLTCSGWPFKVILNPSDLPSERKAI